METGKQIYETEERERAERALHPYLGTGILNVILCGWQQYINLKGYCL
jgi:hypothetical protein